MKKLIIAAFLLIHYSIAYSQKIEPLGSGFVIDRAYAEQMAAKFDSLRTAKVIILQYESSILACEEAKEATEIVSNIKSQEIEQLQTKAFAQWAVIESKTRQCNFLESNAVMLSEQLRKTERKAKRQKFWGSFSGVLGGLAAGVLIGIIIR